MNSEPFASTIPFTFLLGLLFSYFTARLVWARICVVPSSVFHFILLPLLFGYLNTTQITDREVIWIYTVMSFLFLGHFASSTISLLLRIEEDLEKNYNEQESSWNSSD
eukprot:TRINITY_DN13944_c0_g1_i2.p2 TRINITY_DN13944_c0_g1~~TRINITY_DN13944_c0_g1_i2.p2  ORF type:complete len:108 (-),score=14.26 TRINITY_DN13944_c0_g1_i2:204-527(-)